MMLSKLAASPTSALVLAASLDRVVEPLRATICATLKDNAVKQQIERHEDLVTLLQLACALTYQLLLTFLSTSTPPLLVGSERDAGSPCTREASWG